MASNLVLFSKLDNPFSGPNPTKLQIKNPRSIWPDGEAAGVGPREGHAASSPWWRILWSVQLERRDRSVAQLDAAARGAFALDRDFDTMSRMVRRLHDEVEHGRDVIRLFMEDGDMDGGWMMLREVVRELQVSDGCFMDQLAELEEHVYLCFLNINRARRMVLEEMLVHQRH